MMTHNPFTLYHPKERLSDGHVLIGNSSQWLSSVAEQQGPKVYSLRTASVSW